MGQAAEDLINAQMFGGPFDPVTGEYNGYSKRRYSKKKYHNRFGSTKNGALFGIYHFLTSKPKKIFPNKESAHLIMEQFSGISDPNKAAEKIQKDFSSFAKYVNEVIKK